MGGAIEWTRGTTVVWHGTPDLPPGFTVTANKTETLLKDGAGSAWSAWSGSGHNASPTIYYEKRGASSPFVVYRPDDLVTYPALLGLSGPYVLLDDTRRIVVLDTRTGAAATLIRDQGGFTTAAAGGGVLALNQIGSHGGAQLSLLEPDGLPALRC